MEIEGKDGSKTLLKPDMETQFGRGLGLGLGFPSNDPTVSRHHVSFQFHKSQPTVEFQVTGKNPIWVQCSKNADIRVYKRFDKGQMEAGDKFCVSAKDPVWFTLKNIEMDFEDELAGTQDLDIQSLDVSNIHPLKEFGFVVMGHEFDGYPKKMMIDIKKWNWFLEEPEESSDDEEVGERKGKKGLRRKRKKKGEENDDDDEWTGESEDDKEIVMKSRKVQGPKYSTRAKDRDKTMKGTKVGKNLKQQNTTHSNQNDNEDEDEEDADEDDETLGGFIADDDDVVEDLESDDEEEEFDEEDDEE